MAKNINKAVECRLALDFVGAIELCTQALRIDRCNSEAYGLRAALQLEMSEFALAAQDASRALEYGGPALGPFRIRAMARYHREQWVAAIEDCDAVLELDQEDSDVWCMRGFAKGQILDTKGALEDSSQALHLNPSDAGALRVRGAAQLELGDLSGAIADLREALCLNPEDQRGMVLLAMAESKAAPEGLLETAEGAEFGNTIANLASLDSSLGGLDFMDGIQRDAQSELDDDNDDEDMKPIVSNCHVLQSFGRSKL